MARGTSDFWKDHRKGFYGKDCSKDAVTLIPIFKHVMISSYIPFHLQARLHGLFYEWRAYSSLATLGYSGLHVLYCQNFVNPRTGIILYKYQ